MTEYIIGVDSGSTFSKIILMKKQEIQFTIIDTVILGTNWDLEKVLMQCIQDLCDRNDLSVDGCKIVSTGYGRDNLSISNKSITEITCHAKGALFLDDSIGGIIDIGGQDSKVISIENGKIKDFIMNDKCAAGTGRFLNMICERLELSMEDLNNMSDIPNPVSINSMCAVFAESEIIGLLMNGESRENIMNGVLVSIVQKIVQMMNKTNLDKSKKILFTGGLANIILLQNKIIQLSGYQIEAHVLSVFAGAIGASLLL